MILENLLASILGVVASLAAALVAQYLARRQRQLSRRSEETAEAIATLIRTRHEDQKTATLAKLLDKLPDRVSAEEFVSRLEPLVIRLTDIAPTSREEVAPVGSLVNAYHEQALSQAQVQFWFSVVAATVGFAWILYAALK
jgi:hypothetical protein